MAAVRKQRLRSGSDNGVLRLSAHVGIPVSSAINMFYKQIILNRGLPFEVKLPTAKPVGVAELSEAELNAELEKGYADIKSP